MSRSRFSFPLGLLAFFVLSILTVASGSDPDDINWATGQYMPGIDSTVCAMTEFQGKLIIAGDFEVAGTIVAHHVVAWDGVSWSNLGDGSDGTVYSLIVFDNQLIAGGGFLTMDGDSMSHIAAWNGSSWSPLAEGTDSAVYALSIFNGDLIVGGDFTTAGTVSASHVASWDGTTWSSLSSGTDNTVKCLGQYDGQLVAGGDFNNAGGGAASKIATWDGASWSPIGTGLSGGVFALIEYDGFLFAASASSWSVSKWDGSSWTISMGAHLGNLAKCFVVHDSLLILGGHFDGDVPGTYDVGVWDGTNWQPLGFKDGADSVCALASYNGKLYAAGKIPPTFERFTTNIVQWDGNEWSGLGLGFERSVLSITDWNGNLIVGGEFHLTPAGPANRIMSWNPCSSWTALGSGIRGNPVVTVYQVRALCTYDGMLIAGGKFDSAGTVAVNNIAAWDGSSWSSLDAVSTMDFNALVVYDNKLYGCGSSYDFFGYWDGSSWTDLTSDLALGKTMALAVYDGKLIVAGYFAQAGGITVNNIAAWDGSNWSALGTGITAGLGRVASLTVYDSMLVAGGNFNKAGGTSAVNIAAWDGSSWSALGTGLPIGWVYALTAYDSLLVAGGYFGGYVGSPDTYYLAYWDGTSWSQLGSGVNDLVRSLQTYGSKLIVGGELTRAGDKASAFLAEWFMPVVACGDADGSGAVDIDDVVYLIAYIFLSGPPPDPLENGDSDCSGAIDIDDVVYLIAYIFSGGPDPCACCPT